MEGEVTSAVEQTRRLMQAGTTVIYQAHLMDGAWSGRADFLMRVEAPSKLGPYSYWVIDTKLAAETRAGTILQLCLYSDLVRQVQGTLPEHMLVVTPVQCARALCRARSRRCRSRLGFETAVGCPPAIGPSLGVSSALRRAHERVARARGRGGAACRGRSCA
jgi:predicted RecB family nuclease